MAGKVELDGKKLLISEEVEDIFRKEVTPIGNGAKVGCPKKHVGKTAYVVVCKE